jgi:hypothetical protein
MNKSSMSAVVNGAFVYWDAGVTEHSVILPKLIDLGLDHLAPSKRTPNEALAKALKDYGEQEIAKICKGNDTERVKRTALVQPRLSQDKNGLELLTVTRKAGPNDYDQLLSAKVDPLTDVVEITDGWAPIHAIQESYNAYRRQCSGSQVGQSLVSILKYYHATCVRAAGGLYYLPDDLVDDWDMVAEAFEHSSKENLIHRVKIVMDENAARTVRFAITQELVKAAGEIAEDLKTISKDTAIELRQARADGLRKKCERYKRVLSDDLVEVEAVLNMAEVALNAATAVQESEEVFEGILD